MRAVLLIVVAGCGFTGAPLGGGDGGGSSIDAVASTTDDALSQPIDSQSHDATLPPPVDAQMVDAAPPPLTCPSTDGWTQVNGMHLYFSSGQNHWGAAETDCELRGIGFSATHLVVIGEADKATMIAAHMTDPYEWIGHFQDLGATTKDNHWNTVLGGIAYAGWDLPNEPNNGGNPEDTLTHTEQFAQLLKNNAKFNDTKGTDNLHYICECDGNAPPPGIQLLYPSSF